MTRRVSTTGLLCVLIAGLSLIAVPAATRAETTVGPSDEHLLALRGNALRADVRAAFNQLRKDRALRFHAQGGNDVTPLILKYVPLGTRMADAVGLMTAAGYTLGVTDDGQVFARAQLIGPFLNAKPSGLEILLKPTDRSEAATLAEVHAEIFRKPLPKDVK